jgi:hypothetical protein
MEAASSCCRPYAERSLLGALALRSLRREWRGAPQRDGLTRERRGLAPRTTSKRQMRLTLRLPEIKLLCYLLELTRYYFSKQVTKGNARAFLAVVLEVPAEASTEAHAC